MLLSCMRVVWDICSPTVKGEVGEFDTLRKLYTVKPLGTCSSRTVTLSTSSTCLEVFGYFDIARNVLL